ncbi:hypothetical protein [Paracoccus methylarcula]|uniref:Uncharacterized protein n=1 Tax=Paracoccus methylarcula TaxID=72022 RepID=A0A3R7M8J8_9RHOB|nr:hypothetical protein [Paracoccus methylarcula]RNF33988.1 hypothetical protein A7A09_013875 [Paracoccus methylarcula]
MMIPTLTVMPDFGMGPFLWVNGPEDNSLGVGGNCCDATGRCGSHPMSDDLFEAFKEWIFEFESASWRPLEANGDSDDWERHALKEPELILDWNSFHARGLELARRLKAEVGANFRVVYEKPMEDPQRRIDEWREIRDDGSVVVLSGRFESSN